MTNNGDIEGSLFNPLGSTLEGKEQDLLNQPVTRKELLKAFGAFAAALGIPSLSGTAKAAGEDRFSSSIELSSIPKLNPTEAMEKGVEDMKGIFPSNIVPTLEQLSTSDGRMNHLCLILNVGPARENGYSSS